MLKSASVSTRVSLVALIGSALSLGCLTGCADIEAEETNELVEETTQALGAETCNGIDDDGDFMIDEDAANTRNGAACSCTKKTYAGHEYLDCNNQRNWDVSQSICKGRGMNLARIGSTEENAFLQPFAVGTTAPYGVWIDINDRAIEGDYRYSDGSQASFLNWAWGEPNNAYGNEHCGLMFNTGTWNDLGCHRNSKSFCELLDPVIWTNAVGVGIEGTTLTKTSTGSGWDAGAASYDDQDIITGNGFVQFSTNENNTLKTAGLNDVDSGRSRGEIDYAITLRETGIVEVHERNDWRGSFGSYVAGDVFRVEILDGQVRYLRNGALMYSHAVTPAYPLFADTSLVTNGATIADVRIASCEPGDSTCIEPGMWKNAKLVLAKDGAVKKVGGAGGLDGWAQTIATASGDMYAEFASPDVGSFKMAGLDDDGMMWNDSLRYAIRFNKDTSGNPTATVYENGSMAGACQTTGSTMVVTYAAGDKFRIEIRDGFVSYSKQGTVFCTHQTVAPAVLMLDEYLGTTGTSFTESKFGPL